MIASMVRSWSLGDGEAARILPKPLEGAEIVSRGRMPFRLRSEGSFRVRSACPGTAVVLGEATYEVLDEHLGEGRVVYRLRPWQANEILRGQVVYDEGFVRGIEAERQRTRARERARPFRFLLNPLVGSLPEADQERLAERLGLDAVQATFVSALVEMLLCSVLFSSVAKDAGPVESISILLLAPGLALLPLLALGRAFAALALKETSGQWAVVAGALLLRSLVTRRPGRQWQPLGRARFWALLSEPDLVEPEEEGAFIVRSLLPHLSWTREHRALIAGVRWEAQTLAVELSPTGPVFAYRLVPPVGGEGSLEPPDARSYARSVREALDAEWDDVLSSMAFLVSCLDSGVQRRAVGRAGGAARLRKAVLGTAGFAGCLGLFILFELVGGPAADPLRPTLALIGFALVGDAALRLTRALQGRYAPSLVRFFLPSSLLRPERVQYLAHREAWRDAAEAEFSRASQMQ